MSIIIIIILNTDFIAGEKFSKTIFLWKTRIIIYRGSQRTRESSEWLFGADSANLSYKWAFKKKISSTNINTLIAFGTLPLLHWILNEFEQSPLEKIIIPSATCANATKEIVKLRWYSKFLRYDLTNILFTISRRCIYKTTEILYYCSFSSLRKKK